MNQELPPGIDEPPAGAETTAVATATPPVEPKPVRISAFDAMANLVEEAKADQAADKASALQAWRGFVDRLAAGSDLDGAEVSEMISAGEELGMRQEEIGEAARADVAVVQQLAGMVQSADEIEAELPRLAEEKIAAKEELRLMPKRAQTLRLTILRHDSKTAQMREIRSVRIPRLQAANPRLFAGHED